jgi:ADP-heptose:LPS heptosyltransferase
MRLRLVGSRRAKFRGARLSKPYDFRAGVWVDVDPNDASYLLGHKTIILEEEALGKVHLEVTDPKAASSLQHLREDFQYLVEPVATEPPQVMCAPHIARVLERTGGFRRLTLSEYLETDPTAKVLITRPGGLGDLLLMTPALKELHRRYPESLVWIRTWEQYGRALVGCSGVAGSSGMDASIKEAPFSQIVDLSGYVEFSKKQHVHRSDLFAEAFGVELTDYTMEAVVSQADIETAQSLLSGAPKEKPLVGIQVSNPNPRRVASQEKMLEISDAVRAAGTTPVFISPQHEEFWSWREGINLTGKMELGTLYGLVTLLDTLVVGDSGLMHLANALQKPNVALFGPVDEATRVKEQPWCHVVRGNEQARCESCNDWYDKQCKLPPRCLDNIPISWILDEVMGICG